MLRVFGCWVLRGVLDCLCSAVKPRKTVATTLALCSHLKLTRAATLPVFGGSFRDGTLTFDLCADGAAYTSLTPRPPAAANSPKVIMSNVRVKPANSFVAVISCDITLQVLARYDDLCLLIAAYVQKNDRADVLA